MSKPIAYCSVTGRGFTEREMQVHVTYGDKKICVCHKEEMVDEFPFSKSPTESIHEMIAQHNATPPKTFYYTEEEVKAMCKVMYYNNQTPFNLLWDKLKKK